MERTREYWENRPEIYNMSYKDFVEEYNECMEIAKKKEEKGNLDPHKPNYIPMTKEEIILHGIDWKEFSRQRGFSEFDIVEYERWHKISGQTDNLRYAVNDPWRRVYSNWESSLYIKHIQRAIFLKIKISDEIIYSYKMVKKEVNKTYNIKVLTEFSNEKLLVDSDIEQSCPQSSNNKALK